MNIKNKLNYSNVASSVALVIAVSGVGGVAYAAGVAKNSVGSPQIKNSQVKTIDLGEASVTGKKVKAGSLGQSDLNKAAKQAFTAGPKAYFDDLNFHNITSGNPDKTIFEFEVPAGNYLVSASANVTNTGGDVNDFTCALSQPIGAELTRTIATSEVRVASGGGELGTISLDGIAINTQTPIELSMTCDGAQAPYSAQVLDPRIVAVKVGATVEK
ncbi:hypothetical protein [Nocardioides bizhenqiangii]|uniref:Camelysin metallo-endopeptidase n=1 Tax=Nocardioides bizhenqiangii TaxID=3095076 RepID=A0ABZ0ZQQ5_9ACTN|nr:MULTISPECIES: hypothetical protein [unclassified Nocardioides]MDZ5619302.1 hypothetical protein [Nocardioides sp. HM23]WQQ26675.1 hypothetical protein SHK19_00240 [Nocardioides sp. HM61]